VFEPLLRLLGDQRQERLLPALSLRLGVTSVREAASELSHQIEAAYPGQQAVDLLGFSIGGVIARSWIQQHGGHRRTRRFISLGSPQQGTITAQPWSSRLFRGLADVKWGSALLQDLNDNLDTLRAVNATASIPPSIWPCCRVGGPCCRSAHGACCRSPPIPSCCAIPPR